jgi:hypothetical protein
MGNIPVGKRFHDRASPIQDPSFGVKNVTPAVFHVVWRGAAPSPIRLVFRIGCAVPLPPLLDLGGSGMSMEVA